MVQSSIRILDTKNGLKSGFPTITISNVRFLDIYCNHSKCLKFKLVWISDTQ